MSGPRKKPNSVPHVFLKNSSSGTDQRLLDADFDRYWDDESKNNNRNRIRVGRQYQATVPPLLKPGEADGRRCEDLETLKWKPDQEISDEQLDNYLSIVKAVSIFAKAINIYQNPDSEAGKCLQNALRGLSEFVTSHHPSQSETGCQVATTVGQSSCTSGAASSHPNRSSPGWSFAEGSLFLKALDVCGKNFAAIKKDFLPWKPLKNLIEYYYCGQKSEGVGNGPSKPCIEDSALENSIELESASGQLKSVGKAKETISSGSVTAATAIATLTNNTTLTEEEKNTVGSLKFFLGGQMVLKLNAKQESHGEGPRCHWVQSKDSSVEQTSAVRKKRKKRHMNGEGRCAPDESTGSGSESDSSWLNEMVAKRKTVLQCSTVVSPKPAWTPPVEKNVKCDDSPIQEDKTGLRGS